MAYHNTSEKNSTSNFFDRVPFCKYMLPLHSKYMILNYMVAHIELTGALYANKN